MVVMDIRKEMIFKETMREFCILRLLEDYKVKCRLWVSNQMHFTGID